MVRPEPWQAVARGISMAAAVSLTAMTDGVDPASTSRPSPREALERAKDALTKLEEDQAAERRLRGGTRIAVVGVIMLAWAGLIIHTFLEKEAPRVDSTSVALLALALIAPFVSRLKALEVGGAKAEWLEGAEVGLTQVVHLAGMHQAALEQLFEEVTRAAATSDNVDAPPPADRALGATTSLAQPLRSLLWVDDHPENNAYEMESLSGILHVVAVKTNEEAFRVLESQEIDAVVSDVRRDYDRVGEAPGGVRLLQELQHRYPESDLPVVYYTSTRSVERYGQELMQQGATGLTSLYSDLLRVLREVDKRNLESLALGIGKQHGIVRVRSATGPGPDVIVELEDGSVLGIEVASWLERPQMAAFVDRAGRLLEALDRGAITRGLLLVRPEVLDDRQRVWAEEHRIELVSPRHLGEAIADRK